MSEMLREFCMYVVLIWAAILIIVVAFSPFIIAIVLLEVLV